MFKAFLALLMASTLHANSMNHADFTYKTIWENRPILSVENLPQKKEDLPPPETTAQSIIAIEVNSGKILYEKNSQEKRPIASLTKLMTSLIITQEEAPNTIVKVSKTASDIEGSQIWLSTDEKISVKDLLYGLLISSGNDAAIALAEFNGGTIEQFVKKMNQKKKLSNGL
ncbi:MAG: serine-type D-Ala-D-Ala carboxypeptidase, D-alanyl-D-alanine carboxypeptidase (penicillin-binding protein 5/6) [Candidatus Peregrinibacteria bacterium GW2011_GWE2_39_6]|nr:MAG: serine-type D-Ala-D-Ala carboxypeptidase, D-alanyl-D-alanine carboxypeptidase (penicillin-binding protein 5/6) [Candidatus Peregrinibacteria bacterium GW2011_GWE2_39_6]